MKAFTYLAALWLSLTVVNVEAQMAHEPGELLVQFKTGTNPIQTVDRLKTLRGIDTGLELGTLLSVPMNIYLVKFNENFVNEDAILKSVRSDRDVSIAQFNHYVYQRSTLPNDPQVSTQWHHENTGQSGGDNDADIDTDLAWDITTGGTTALGDTIVVCVIEGGNLNHPDLQGNAWVNHLEIPGNDIDDDENGFVDDYLGWNVASQNDQGVLQGGHGTQVMGMIGAKGDNQLGVVGANWDVKIMSVAGENISNEASVVSAYSYPLIMRQLYDATNGDKGAFVVATNASWGIDNGNVNDVPVWMAYYDTLGKYGILNCGATANNNVNIDVVGDIPTAAPSDYMISVTATNDNDVRTFSGYGATTVDLGAPGEDVFTTSGTQNYSSTSGTSFASPLTAGIIALLYSAPCETLAQLAHENPQGAADYIRFALFEGVDQVPNLIGQTVTGGRVNAFNSLMILMQNCGEDLCLAPFSFNYTLEEDTVYTFTWNSVNEGSSNVRYRIEGEEEWTVETILDGNSFTISDLLYCTNYEFQVGAICAEGDPVYGVSQNILTEGCCVAPESVLVDVITESSVELTWDFSLSIEAYDVYYRLQGTNPWIFVGNYTIGVALIEGLDACSYYEVLTKPSCVEGFEEAFTETIRTKGCGACLDNQYCENIGEDSFWEFIESVDIADLSFESGNNGGYAFFEDTGIELEVLGEYPLTVTPGFTFGAYNEFIRVWIDFNHDGTYSQSEMVISSSSGSSQALSGDITIPGDATLGLTRMRVAMKYIGNGSGTVGACEVFDEGETEDYCLVLVESTLSSADVRAGEGAISVYPNPSEGLLNVNLPGLNTTSPVIFSVYDVTGKLVWQTALVNVTNVLDLSSLESGVYMFSTVDRSGEVQSAGKLVLSK